MKTIEDRVMYFCDPSGIVEPEIDFLVNVQNVCRKSEIEFINIHYTDEPEFRDTLNYSVLFFDWGGMSFGNSMLQHFIYEIIEVAKENPSKLYVMSSQFTSYATKEILETLKEEEIPTNLFVDVQEFCNFLHKTNFAMFTYKENK